MKTIKNGTAILTGIILLSVWTACNNSFHDLMPTDDTQLTEFKPVNLPNARIGENTIRIPWTAGMNINSVSFNASLPDRAFLLPVTKEYIRAAFPGLDTDYVITTLEAAGDITACLTDLIKRDPGFNAPANIPIDLSGPVSMLVMSGRGTVQRYTTFVVIDVTFNSDGGSNGGVREIEYGANIPSLPDSVKTGYIFNGWYTDPDKTASSKVSSLSNVKSNTTLYADLKPITYTVTYDGNGATGGGTGNSSHTYDIDNTLAANGYTREDYTFDGWNTNPYGSGTNYNAGERVNLTTTAGATVTLYAKWKTTLYTVTFYPDGGSPPPNPLSKEWKEGSKIERPDTMNKTGYTFDDWYTDSAKNTKAVFPIYVYSDVNLYAKWNPDIHTVTYYPDGGTPVPSPNPRTVNYDATIPKPNDPSKTGYTFTGWFKDNGSIKWNFDTDVVKGDTALYAKWEITKYTVTFNSNDGSTVSPITNVNHGTSVSKPTSDPTKTGYTFDKWCTDSGLTAAASFPITVTANVYLYARWNPITYTITYNGNGATGGSTEKSDHTYDVTKNLTTNGFSRDGYDFDGWTNAGTSESYTDKQGVINLASTNNANVTLNAKWKIKTFTVTYYPDGGSSAPASPVTKDYGSTIPAPDAMTKTGHEFDGWYTNSAKTTPASFPITVTDNITLYAKWTIIGYTVTFNSDNGVPPSTTQTVNYNIPATKPADPAKTGYDFGGWYTDLTFTKLWDFDTPVTGEIILYARWINKTFTVDFVLNNGSGTSSQTMKYGDKVDLTPTYAGHTFLDWYKDAACTESLKWNKNTDTVTGNITLYAKWTP